MNTRNLLRERFDEELSQDQVFLDVKVLARSASRDPREYVRWGLGNAAAVDTIEATSDAAVVETLEDSL